MRIAIGQVLHETSTFSAGLTVIEDFRRWAWARGEDVVRLHRGVRDYLGGMLDAGADLGVEVIPTFSAAAYPSGLISAGAAATIRRELTDAVRGAGRVDAVCVALHGAGMAEGIDDLEGILLGDLRGAVGAAVPIVATLDLHANMTAEMLRHASALIGVNAYPHVDTYERGQEALRLAVSVVRGRVRPVMVLVRLPMIIPFTTTNHDPGRRVNTACAGWESVPPMLDCTFFHGFPYTDSPHAGASVLAIADGRDAPAREAAGDVAARVWEMRHAFLPDVLNADDAVRAGRRLAGRPVVINETSDNPGGGAPGDGTHLLRAMLAAGLSEACYGIICDPATVEQVHRAGVGASVDVALGGKTDAVHGAPIETRAYVKCLTDGRFIQQSLDGRGARVSYGRMARVVLGEIDVLVSTVRAQVLDPEVFLLHGIDVGRCKIVALKSSQHFRGGFETIAAHIVTADPPGATTTRLGGLPYARLPRPIWPLDPDEDVERVRSPGPAWLSTASTASEDRASRAGHPPAG
jgi:microcystin degradation protein MlrC